MIKEIESSSMHNNREMDIYIYTYVHKSKGNQIFRYLAVTVVDKIDILLGRCVIGREMALPIVD